MKVRLGMAILAVAVAMPAVAQTDQRTETRSERAARDDRDLGDAIPA